MLGSDALAAYNQLKGQADPVVEEQHLEDLADAFAGADLDGQDDEGTEDGDSEEEESGGEDE
jgi:hypothetical protein